MIGGAQCFAWEHQAGRFVGKHSTNPSDHGTCPRSQTRNSVRAYPSRGSMLYPAPSIPLQLYIITPSVHRLPLCGDAIGGRSANLSAWSIVRSRGCLSSVGPCAWWTVGGLRPVVWLCAGAAQCSIGRPPSTKISDHGTWPQRQPRTTVRAYPSRGSTLHPAPCIPLYHPTERAQAPLCGGAIGGRSACGSAWSIVWSRGCLSCVGPCAWWTVGGLRPVVLLCDGAAQCSMGRPHSTKISDHGTCPHRLQIGD